MSLKSLMTLFVSAVFLSACGGSGESGDATPVTLFFPPLPSGDDTPTGDEAEKPFTELANREEASRFLIQAGFGGTDAEIDDLVGTDAADWLMAQMELPATLTLDEMLATYPSRLDTDREHTILIWRNILAADDVLRQRMFFALSQIFVISDNSFFDEGFMTAYYTDILTQNAFGNYRSLLEDVTYSPAMADYLTYYRNQKGDALSGRMPDENYAREILQLFSIGLVELNLDGTQKTPIIETYDNSDVIGLSRVFTGFSGAGSSFNFNAQNSDWRHMPLQIFDDQHSPLEKSFLGVTIPAETSGTESVNIALDTIADHPNVAPFISRQLIQRFTSSSPSPEYVERVAEAFEAGTFSAPNGVVFGTGERGDLKATLAAILLDESVHDETLTPNEGKIREPVIQFAHYVRSFDLQTLNISEQGRLADTNNPNISLGQHPLRSPSVFNYYRPGFIAPGTETGDAGLTAPEFQIVNSGSSLGFLNFMTHYIARTADDPVGNPGFQPVFTAESLLADDPQALVDHLDIKLTGGQLSEVTKSEMIDVISTLEIDPNDEAGDRQDRVQIAIIMMISSGAFGVIE